MRLKYQTAALHSLTEQNMWTQNQTNVHFSVLVVGRILSSSELTVSVSYAANLYCSQLNCPQAGNRPEQHSAPEAAARGRAEARSL